jgi:hypothetical protein
MEDTLKKKTKRDNDVEENEINESQKEKNDEEQIDSDEDLDLFNDEESSESTINEDDENFFWPKEVYKELKIIDLKEFQNLKSSFTFPETKSSDSLFKIRRLAIKYFNENKYNIEDIIQLDDTNPDIRKKYLQFLINILNKIPKNSSDEIIEILKEKINKCIIILDKRDYEEEINKILDSKIKSDLSYVDYQASIIDCLKYIISDKKGSVNEAKKKLKLKKKFSFNHESNFGQNNYFFYGIAIQIFPRIKNFYKNYTMYEYIINKNLEYFEKNFNNLNKNEIYLFKDLNNLLLSDKCFRNIFDFKNIQQYLEGKPLDENDKINLLNAVNKRNKNESLIYKSIKKISYRISFKNGFLKYIIKEDTKIDRKKYDKITSKKYDINIFNKNIINVLNKFFLYEFEEKCSINVLPSPENSDYFYKDIKEDALNIVRKILKSNAAKKFFDKYYAQKYSEYYSKIEYHFDQDEVIDEIFNRIEFHPIYNPSISGYTDPMDLSIIINSIPGKFEEDVIYVNKKLLQIGRLVIICIHEILGHFLRRYYFYLTHGIIAFNTLDDSIMNINEDGGNFIEKKFLGIIPNGKLFLKDILILISGGKNYDNYPLVKGEITENFLKEIINNNKKIFYFIKEIYEKQNNKKENIKNDLINLKQYYFYLTPKPENFPHVISCQYRKGEDYILLN